MCMYCLLVCFENDTFSILKFILTMSFYDRSVYYNSAKGIVPRLLNPQFGIQVSKFATESVKRM